jgi:hypothetical protein
VSLLTRREGVPGRGPSIDRSCFISATVSFEETAPSHPHLPANARSGEDAEVTLSNPEIFSSCYAVSRAALSRIGKKGVKSFNATIWYAEAYRTNRSKGAKVDRRLFLDSEKMI